MRKARDTVLLILVDKARPKRTGVVGEDEVEDLLRWRIEEAWAAEPRELPPPRTPVISYVIAAGLVAIASIGCLHVANTLSQRRSDARDVQRSIVAPVRRIAPGPAQQPRRPPSLASAPRPMTPTPPVVARSTPRRVELDARPTAEPDPGAVIDWLLEDRTR